MSAAPKLFTPAQANRTLPLVKRVVADILANGRKLRSLGVNGQPPPELQPEFDACLRNLESLFRELQGIGCCFKDPAFSVGLVDFPAVIDGEPVLLCWRGDESEVGYFHGYEEGYKGRRPIPERYLQGTPD